MSEKILSVGMRFLKGALAGAFSTMGMITWAMPTTWTELGAVLNMLAIAGICGAITGVLLAGEKWVRWTE